MGDGISDAGLSRTSINIGESSSDGRAPSQRKPIVTLRSDYFGASVHKETLDFLSLSGG